MWRAGTLAVLAVALSAVANAQQTDEEKIAELEEELDALREEARQGRVSCTAAGGFVSIVPTAEGNGYTITNVTSSAGEGEGDEGLTVLEVALSDQDTDIVLPNMIVRVSRGQADAAESSAGAFEIPGLSDLTGGMDIWGVIGGNLLTWLFGCTFFGIIIAIEKKYKCIGGDQIHEMVEQHHYLQKELTHVIHAIKGEETPTSSPSSARGMVVEGAEGLDMENGASSMSSAAGFAMSHKANVGKGAGIAAEIGRAKSGSTSAKAGLLGAGVNEAKKLEGMSPEELMAKGKLASDKGEEFFEKVKDVNAARGDEGSKSSSGSKSSKFGRKSVGGGKATGGMKAKPGGGFTQKGGGGGGTGTKFQNPMNR
jgi:hypothetical protein